MESGIYQAMYANEDRFWWHAGMGRIINSLLGKYLDKKENKILDVGCGTGGMFKILSNYGRVWGVDKSNEALSYARCRRRAEQIIQAEADNLPFSDRFFDVITCFDVLYHQWIKDDAAVLQELYRVLKPGGILIIREAAYNWLRGQHDALVWTKHRFVKKELEAKLSKAGFMVKKSSYVNFFLFPLALLKRLSEKNIPEKDLLKHIFSANKLTGIIFKMFLYGEALLIKYIKFPYGLSIVCVAKK